MNGKAGAPKATPHVNAAVEADICHLRSGGGGWEAGVHMLAQAGDPVTAYSLPHNDWYQLRRSLEIVKVFIVLQMHSYTLFGLHLGSQFWTQQNNFGLQIGDTWTWVVNLLMQVSGHPCAAFPKPCNYREDGVNGDTEWDYDFQCYFLYQHRADLYHWIDLRCEQMVAGTFRKFFFWAHLNPQYYCQFSICWIQTVGLPSCTPSKACLWLVYQLKPSSYSMKIPVQRLRECCSSLWLACCKFWCKYLRTLMCVDAETGGLLEEASWLLDMGVMPNTSSASRGIGYQEVWSLFSFPLKHPVSISGLAMLLSRWHQCLWKFSTYAVKWFRET